MPVLPVVVQEVRDRRSFRRFADLPLVLHESSPHVRAELRFERRRLNPDRNPYFVHGDAAYFLARRSGDAAGRIAAHVTGEGDLDGRFGFFATASDPDVARALLESAALWLSERGCQTMTGPFSFGPADGAAILMSGYEQPPATGRSWNPPWYADLLEGAGMECGDELATYRLPAAADANVEAEAGAEVALCGFSRAELALPVALEAYADPALQLTHPDHGVVLAVPNVAGAMAEASARRAWSLAKRARTRDWDSAVVIGLDGDAARLVAAVRAAAAAAGYRALLAPWTPDPQPASRTARPRGSSSRSLGSSRFAIS